MWVSPHEKSLELSFVSEAESKPESGVVVEARMRGGAAKSLGVYLDGKSLTVLTLMKGEAKVVPLRAPGASAARGSNERLLRVNGAPKSTRDNLAEIDRIRVGAADGDAPYAAPTRGDALTTVTIGDVARRATSLRASGSVCAARGSCRAARFAKDRSA